MNPEPGVARVLNDLSDQARVERMPDPLTLRRRADRRHRRRLAVAAACVAALVAIPLTATVARHSQSAPPVSPHGFDCLTAAHGPPRASWSGPGDGLNKPGWVETFPAVPPHHKAEFTSVAANETGYLVNGRTYAGAFGPTFHDNEDKSWFSTNGRTWTTYPRPTGVGNAVLAIGDRFYSSGYGEDGSPAMWTTTNGRDWHSTTITHRPTPADSPDSTGIYLNRLSCIDAQLVAYGTVHGDKAGWTTTDGQHWSRLDPKDSVLSSLHTRDQPSLAGDGPTGTLAIPPWGEGWAPGRIWFNHS